MFIPVVLLVCWLALFGLLYKPTKKTTPESEKFGKAVGGYLKHLEKELDPCKKCGD